MGHTTDYYCPDCGEELTEVLDTGGETTFYYGCSNCNERKEF